MSDATPTYRGYRHQALYTLSRILDITEDYSIQPEGYEDVALIDRQGNIIEIVQVKSHTSNLTLSSFSPEKPESFFYRAASLIEKYPSIKIKILSFGDVGIELKNALSNRTVEKELEVKKVIEKGNKKKNLSEKERVITKLVSYKHINEPKARILFDKITINQVTEGELIERVFSFLESALTGIDPKNAFELLNYWLFKCAEFKTIINKQDLINKIASIGKFLTETALHYKEWFTTIIPVEDYEINNDDCTNLANDYYEGISANYKHILANLDVQRPIKLEEINQKFNQNNIVIVHGASGQGKTTLALRYLHDYFPNNWRYRIQIIENKDHALSIARAILGHAKAIDVPFIIYIDVSFNDYGWYELAKQLSENKSIYILITIREEDFRRTNVSRVDFKFAEVELTFSKKEATEIYDLFARRNIPAEFITFEDAWNKFGGNGPLLEFVYFITHGNSLQDRLTQQINNLYDRLRRNEIDKNEIELLRLASVASAYGAQILAKSTFEILGLLAPKRTIELFEKEYLLKISEDGLVLNGLHQIRSEILVTILTDDTFNPWSDAAKRVLNIIHEHHLETFLLYSFSRRKKEANDLLAFLESFEPCKWTGINGILHSLIWLSLTRYIEENNELIRDMYKDSGRGWQYIFDSDIVNVSSDESREWWKGLPIPDNRKLIIETFRKRQTDKSHVFNYVVNWLKQRTIKPESPITKEDYSSMGEVIFWLGRLEIIWDLDQWLSDINLNSIVGKLPVEIIADLSLGFFTGCKSKYLELMTSRTLIIEKYCNDTQTIHLEDDGQSLKIHYILGNELTTNNNVEDTISKNIFHKEAMSRLFLLWRLFPDRDTYSNQCYGHNLLEMSYDFVEEKQMPNKNFYPLRLTTVNSTFSELVQKQFRPKTWIDYIQQVLDIRKAVINSLNDLSNVLNIYFRKENHTEVIQSLDSNGWDNCNLLLKTPVILPECAFDEWGFFNEFIDLERHENEGNEIPKGLLSVVYRNYLASFSEYSRTLSNFFTQAIHTLSYNPLIGRLKDINKNQFDKVAKENGINSDFIRLSFINLTDAYKSLSPFQKEFEKTLGKFLSIDDISSINKQENEIFSTIWSMWYYFAFTPNHHIQSAKSECIKRFEEEKRKFKNKLRQVFHIQISDVDIKILNSNLEWEKNTALWLSINSKNVEVLYNSIEKIIHSTKEVFNTTSSEVKTFVLPLYWSRLVIIPLLEGKSLDSTAFSLNLLTIVLRDSEPLNFIPLPMSVNILKQLNIETWKDEKIIIAQKLVKHTTELYFITKHITLLSPLKEIINENSAKRLQNYLVSMEGVIMNSFNLIIALANDLEPYLEILTDLFENLKPKFKNNEEPFLELDDLSIWLTQLETVKSNALGFYSLILNDVVTPDIIN